MDAAALKQRWIVAYAAWLWILPILVIGAGVLWLFWKRNAKRRLARFVSPRMFGQSIPAVHWRGRAWFFASGVFALALLALALARPLHGPKPDAAERTGVDFVVVLDVSKSMWVEDVAPNRLQAVKKELSEWLKTLTGDRMGLVLFAGDAVVQAPMTFDYTALDFVLNAANPKVISLGGTNIPRAMETATHLLQRSDTGGRFVILVSDGENLEGNALDAVRKARLEDGITLFTVGVGTPQGGFVPATDYTITTPKKDHKGNPVKHYINSEYGTRVISRLDERALRMLAEAGGGRYVPFNPGVQTFRQLRERSLLPLAQKNKTIDVKDYTEWYQLPLGLAIALIVLQALIPTIRRKTAPDGIGVKIELPENLSRTVKIIAFIFVSGVSVAAGATPVSPEHAAEALLRENKNDEAVALMRTAVEADEHDPWLFYNYALTLYRAERFDEATAAFQAIAHTAQDPALITKAVTQMGNAQVHLGLRLQKRNTQHTGAILALERALSYYDEAAAGAPGATLRHNRKTAAELLENVLMEAGEKFVASADYAARINKPPEEADKLKNALQAYERVLELNEKNTAAQTKVEQLRERLARNLAAQAQALEQRADTATENPQAKPENINRLHEQALDKLDEALTHLPDDTAINAQKDNLQKKMSDALTAQAEKQLEKPLEKDALNAREQDIVAAAKNKLDTALSLNPDNQKAQDLQQKAAQKLEESYVQEGQKALDAIDKPYSKPDQKVAHAQKAATQFQKALDLNPENQDAQKGLGEAHERLPDLLAAAAEQDANKARDLLGKNENKPKNDSGDNTAKNENKDGAPTPKHMLEAVGFMEKANRNYSAAQAMAPDNEAIAAKAEALRNELSQLRDQLDQQSRARLEAEQAAAAAAQEGEASDSDTPPTGGPEDADQSVNSKSKLLSISEITGSQKPNTGDNFWEKRIKDW